MFVNWLASVALMSCFQGVRALQPTCAFFNNLTTIRFAQSVPLTGSNSDDGVLYRDGILAAFHEFNTNDRPDKRFRLDLDVQDDAGDPQTVIENVQRFVARNDVFGIIGLVGTANIELAAPIALAKGLPVVAPYGGMALRDPFQKFMINLRASFFDEAAAIVKYLRVDLGIEDIALYAQNGTLGDLAYVGSVAALDSYHLSLHSTTRYSKTGDASSWLEDALTALEYIKAISNKPPRAIIVAADFEPAAIFIPQAQIKFPGIHIACLSRVSTALLINRLSSRADNSSALHNLFVSQVVPVPTNDLQEVISLYQSAMRGINITKWSFSGLEGYLMGKLVVAGLDRIPGFTFTPDLFVDAVYQTSFFNLHGLRVGPFFGRDDYDINKDQDPCNQGMRHVLMTQVLPNKTVVQVDRLDFETCGYKTKQWDTLYFGQSCTFTGAFASPCIAFRDGVLAAFKEVNNEGGVRGSTRLKLVTKDDYGKKLIALSNNVAFLQDPTIFGLLGTSSLGIDAVIDEVRTQSDKLIFGAFDGDIDMREPFQRNIVNFRVGILDEIFAVVHHCYYEQNVSKISVLYEATAYGEESRELVARALSEKRLTIFSQAAYDSKNVTEAVESLFAGAGHALEAVLFVGLDDALGDVVVSVHSRNRNVMVYALSKSITTKLLDDANQDKVNWDKFGMTSCVPDVNNQSMEVVARYVSALMRHDDTLWPSPLGLEGYVVGSFLALSLNSIMGLDLTVENLLKTIYDHGAFDIFGLYCGPLQDASTSGAKTSCNQCMNEVFLIGFEEKTPRKLPSLVFDTCIYSPTTNVDFQLNGFRLAFVFVAGLGIIYTLVVMVLLVRYRQNPHVRPISVRFSLASCIGAILCFGGVFLLHPIPSDFTCELRPWLADLAFVLLFGPVFAKTYRIDKIFNGKKLKHQVISDAEVARVLLLMVVVFGVFLIVYMCVDLPHMQERFTSDGLRYEDCASQSPIFTQMDYVLKALVMLWGCILCLRVSKISGQFARFNESKQLVLCIYHTAFLSLGHVLISLTTSALPNVYFGCVSGLLIQNTVTVVSVLYARPVWFAIQNRAEWEDSDSSNNSTATTSGTKRVSSSMVVSRKSAQQVTVSSKRSSKYQVAAMWHHTRDLATVNTDAMMNMANLPEGEVNTTFAGSPASGWISSEQPPQ